MTRLEQLERRMMLAMALDPNFGSGGRVLASADTMVHLFANGDILAGGSGQPNGSVVTRLNPDGTLDTSFSGDGRMEDAGNDQVVDSNRLYIVDSVVDSDTGDTVARLRAYTLEGTFDNSFSGDGRLRVPFRVPAGEELVGVEGLRVFADPSGTGDLFVHIVVSTLDGNQHEIVKFDSAGVVQTEFGDNGVLIIDGPEVENVELTTRGILVQQSSQETITRYRKTDGEPDSTFSGDGVLDTASQLLNKSETPDGKIILVNLLGSDDVSFTRYNANGTLDIGYGSGGTVLLETGSIPVSLVAAVDDVGRVVVGGPKGLWRIDSSGAVERLSTDDAFASQVGFDTSGRIIFGDQDAVKRFAEIDAVSLGENDVININGTDGDDVVTVTRRSGGINVTLNGVVSSFVNTRVIGVNAKLGLGDDRMTVGLDLLSTISAGSGNDTITTSNAADQIAAGAGSDVINMGGGRDNILYGGSVGDHYQITGGDGDKTLRRSRSRGRVTLTLGTGTHDIEMPDSAGSGVNNISIAGGNNELVLDGAGSTLNIGGTGTNSIWVRGEGSNITTGDGRDRFRVDVFATIRSSGGSDLFDVRELTDANPLSIFAGAGDDRVVAGATAEISRMIVRGGDGNDTLNGGIGVQEFFGEAGDDVLSGGTENDELSGGSGNDSMFGGTGNDDLADESGANVINGNAGNDTIRGGSGPDQIFGHGDKDLIYGGSGNDTMDGGDGRDWLFGQIGEDQLFGGTGDDFLNGRQDADTHFGGDGNDEIVSDDDGVDIVNGDAGNDTSFADNGIDIIASVETRR